MEIRCTFRVVQDSSASDFEALWPLGGGMTSPSGWLPVLSLAFYIQGLPLVFQPQIKCLAPKYSLFRGVGVELK